MVVGMSGGVDSSVAAALLKEQGYDVVGIMLRLWSEPSLDDDDGEPVAENKCCSIESMADARRVASALDIPFYVVNVEEPFRETIVDYFYDEYAAGRTPNPCLRCNRYIRFTLLLERAMALGADYLATGHYVRVDDDPATGLRRLRRGSATRRISPTCSTSSRSSSYSTRSSRSASSPSHRCANGGRSWPARGDQGREPGDLLRRQERLSRLPAPLRH